MTANPTYPDASATAAMWNAPDDIDLGFDALISRYATHRLLDAKALSRLRPDLARLISPPEVTFAAYLADGTIVLCCPEGVPESLEQVVDVLDPSHPLPATVAVPPVPAEAAVQSDLVDRLDDLSRKLDLLQRDQFKGGQIADRLDEVKTALLDGLAQAAARDPSPEVMAEKPDPQTLAADMVDSIHQIVQQSEQRMLTFLRHANRTPALAPQIDGIEQGLRQVMAATADQSAMHDTLRRLQDQIDGLITRPIPSVDLSIQRQGVAQFLEAMGTVIRRLDGAIDRLDSPMANPHLTEISNHLTFIVAQLDDMGTATIDLSPVSQALHDLRYDIGRSVQDFQPTTDAVQHLAQRIDALALRPDPVLDLTQQRQSFAQFGEAMGQVLRRLDCVAEVFSAQPDTARLLAETQSLRTDIQTPFAQVEAHGGAIADIAAKLADLMNRPAPSLDLTAQRTSFAQFTTVISQTLRRLEAHGEKQDTRSRDLQAIAAQAILGLMHSQQVGPDAAPADAAQSALALRTALAEAMAKEFMTRGWQPVALD
jgi:uncharacterized protein YoxC